MFNNSIVHEDIKSIYNKIDLSYFDNKKVLLTGATGLIGSYILYLFNLMNSNCIHAMITATCRNALPDFLGELNGKKWLNIKVGDITDENFINQLDNYDVIIHAAGYGQPAKFVADELKTLKINAFSTFKLFEKLSKNGAFLFISSAGIYNGLDKEEFFETDVGTTNTLHPRACYLEGKKCGETICNIYNKTGINAKSIRLSYIYGPCIKFSDERALYSFIKKAHSGDINMLDDGAAQRIYCYVSDAILAIFNILLNGKETIYNFGGIEKITIKDLACNIAKRFNRKVIFPKIQNSVLGNAKFERINIDKYRNEFNINSFVDLNDGLNRTISWFENYYK